MIVTVSLYVQCTLGCHHLELGTLPPCTDMTSALAPASALLQVLVGGLLVLGLQRILAPGPEAVSGELRETRDT